MEIPSSSPVYTPLKAYIPQHVEPMESVVLFPSKEPADSDQTTAEPVAAEAAAVPAGAMVPSAPPPQREESVIRSSDEEDSQQDEIDVEEDRTVANDEFHWSFAQRPVPEARAVVENSLAEEEPLEISLAVPPSLAGGAGTQDQDETIFSDSDEGDLTDSDMTAVAFGDGTPEKSTQNYLSELLTDSLLESLPLPPERKQHLRDVAR